MAGPLCERNIVASRALGLLYSYNCVVHGRPHREIKFPVWAQDWISHDCTEVSLTINVCLTGIIVKSDLDKADLTSVILGV